jgi:general secretion pathway protein G
MLAELANFGEPAGFSNTNMREAQLTLPAQRQRLKEVSVRRHTAQSGFTLVELMVVMSIIGILMLLAVPSYVSAVKHAQEAVLREDLHVMRTAIDSYTMDKQKAPQSLDDLIQDGYLKQLPEDPMTHSKDTWVTDQSQNLYSLDQTDPGVDDVHSGSTEQGSNGQPYNTW